MAERTMPAGLKFFFTSPVIPKLMQTGHVLLYRGSGGRLGQRMMGVPILLLTTRGRKTGKARTTPLMYLQQGDEVAIVASKGGFPSHPLYRNLTAEPSVRVQIGSQVRDVKASTAGPDERARWWPKLVQLYPTYADYQSWSDREIPVVLLR